MIYNPTRALELLRLGTGLPSANFRDGQQEAIRYIVEGRGRLLVVQKTGWGKSFVYFIATKLLREAGRGPALLISPLLALLRNQIAAAERMGVRAATINSDNQNEWGDIETKLARNEIDILLISPERLENDRFRTRVLARIAGRTTLLVIDEAHCISEKTAMNREPHEPLRDCRLVLISPYDPRSGFNVGRAMQRNKLIYALADLALVVSSDLNKGGTWSGAVEQLDKLKLVPVYVRSAGERSAGLAALRDKGARDWPEPGDVEAFNAVFTASVQPMPEPGPPERDAAEARAATATTGEEDRPTVPDFKEPSEPTAPEMPEAKQEDLFD